MAFHFPHARNRKRSGQCFQEKEVTKFATSFLRGVGFTCDGNGAVCQMMAEETRGHFYSWHPLEKPCPAYQDTAASGDAKNLQCRKVLAPTTAA